MRGKVEKQKWKREKNIWGNSIFSCASVIKRKEAEVHSDIRTVSCAENTAVLFLLRFPREMENCGKCRGKGVPDSRFQKFYLYLAVLIVLAVASEVSPFADAAAYPLGTKLMPKRMAFPTVTNAVDDGYWDYQSGVRYDEYPIVVPKRAALILDRILKEIESAKDSNQLINDWSPISRRGNNKDKLYFRCYFNAVSCYRRK